MSSIDTTTSAVAARTLNRSHETPARPSTVVPTFVSTETDDLDVSGKFDTQRQNVLTAMADLQTSVSTVQAASSNLGGISDLLSQMDQVAQQAGAGTTNSTQLDSLQQQFKALQDQLANQAGGDPAAGVSAVIDQDKNGAYTLDANSPEASPTINQALQETKQADGALGLRLDRLQRAGMMLQVEHANLESAVPSLQDADEASAAMASAKASLLADPSSGLASQSGQTAMSALKLLED
jgi:flagellin